MKRKLVIVLSLLCVLACVLPAFTMAETVKLAYAGGSLHLRKGPGTTYASNGYVQNGDAITVLSKGSVWSKIKTSDNREGYIKNLYISGIGSTYADGTTYYGGSKAGKVTTKYSSSTVYLRAGASSSSTAITKLASGTSVKVLGENGKWYLVETKEGTQGYMSMSYIKTSASASTPATVTATVTGSVVNMRKGPSTDYSIVTSLAKGTKVTVLEKTSSKWWLVKYNSYTGYMSAAYLK